MRSLLNSVGLMDLESSELDLGFSWGDDTDPGDGAGCWPSVLLPANRKDSRARVPNTTTSFRLQRTIVLAFCTACWMQARSLGLSATGGGTAVGSRQPISLNALKQLGLDQNLCLHLPHNLLDKLHCL